MSALILDWEQAAEQGPAIAGGKGWQLARLAGLGVPVPDGFILAAAASHGRRPGDAVPEAVLAAVARELMRRDWSDRPLAVRSSAAQEDSGTASFAGIHLSRLNVLGVDALEQAIGAVWDSAYSAQATAYRQRLGLSQDDPAMAVVIMPLLPAQSSGVIFTCDPASGRDDQMLINAHWGLGESLVGGQADGDEIRLQGHPVTDDLRETHRRTGAKLRHTRLAAVGGTELADTPADLAARAVLTTEQAVTLGRLARDTARALDFAKPQYDVEWVWDGAAFWIVQARPVTACGRHTYAELRTQPAFWSRGNTREVVPDPLSPLDWDNSLFMVNRMLAQGWELAGYPVLEGAQRAGLFHGRLYLEASLMQWEAFDALGVPPKAINSLMGGRQPEITVPVPHWRQFLRRMAGRLRYMRRSRPLRRAADGNLRRAHEQGAHWRGLPLPKDNAALADLLRHQFAALRGADDLFYLQGSGGGALSALLGVLEKRFPGESHALAAALLAGGDPSVTARQGYDLIALAQVAARDAQALEWLRRTGRDGAGWRQSLPAHSPFRTAFAEFLERYGHRAVAETYLRNPRWRERPDYLLDVILGLIGTDGEALRQRQTAASAEAQKRLDQSLPAWLRRLVRALLRSATQECNHREAARSALMALGEPLRRTLLALGTRLGLGADIFNLCTQEVLAAAEGRLDLHFAMRRAALRRAQLAEWAAVGEPEIITLHGTAPPVAAPAGFTDGAWHGTAVGAGAARGRAHVAARPDAGTGMTQGDILVAPSTDPAWTPLFLKAAGLVMETGGYLSHGAIVAREFGIPAVVNLSGILAQVNSGQMLEVDGGTGTVRRITPSPAG